MKRKFIFSKDRKKVLVSIFTQQEWESSKLIEQYKNLREEQSKIKQHLTNLPKRVYLTKEEKKLRKRMERIIEFTKSEGQDENVVVLRKRLDNITKDLNELKEVFKEELKDEEKGII